MDAVFARAPARVLGWRRLVCALDDAHGETFVRLWLMDVGIAWQPQPRVDGAGRFDGRVSPNVYIEVDGAQHDPEWTGATPSNYDKDHDRDTTVVMQGGHVLRYLYRQLYGDWPRVLAAIEKARRDDLELIERRRRRPDQVRTSRRKRGRSSRGAPPHWGPTPDWSSYSSS